MALKVKRQKNIFEQFGDFAGGVVGGVGNTIGQAFSGNRPQAPQARPQPTRQIPQFQVPRPQVQAPQSSLRFSPQAQQNINRNQQNLQKSVNNIGNPLAIAGDIVNAGSQTVGAVGKFGSDMINNLGNRAADFGQAGAEVIREATGENQADYNRKQAQAAEYKRMADSFVNRARNARTQQDFDKYIKQARSLYTAESDTNDLNFADINRGMQATDPRKTLTNAAETALDVATLGKGKALLDGVRTLSAPVTKQALLQLSKNAALTTAQGAGIGGSYGAVNTARDPNATVEDYATNIATSAAIGGGIGLGAQIALPAIGGAAAKGNQAVAGRVGDIKAQPGYSGQTGSINVQKPKVAFKQPQTTADKVNQQLNAAAEAEKNRYKVNPVVKLKNKVMETYNPANSLAKIDRANAKAMGIKFKDLPADQRLEHLHDVSSNSRQQANELLAAPTRTGSSANDIIKHYGEGTPAGKAFNNYTNAKFDLEFRAKHGKPIQAGMKTEDLETLVKAYEAKDPNALHALATKKAINDQAVDTIVAGGGLSRAEGEIVKNSYENAVPLSRLVSEDLQRVQIGGNSRGSISKQTVVQRLEGNSQIPLDNSFTPLVNRVSKAVSQANRAKLAQAYSERVRSGVAPGELLVGAGNKAARKDLAGQRAALNKGINGLNKEISINGKWARKLSSEINNLNKQGLKVSLKNTSEPSLAGKLVDPSLPMSARETKNVVDSLFSLPSKDVAKIQSKIATREPKLAARLDEIIQLKKNIEGAKDAKGIIKENIAQLQDDPTTGRQVISGLVDGEQFKIEVPPDIARAMQGLDETQLNTLLKVGHGINKVFQTAWTGFLQPAFSLVSYAIYDPAASVIISKQGFKTFRPSAVAQMFKSFTGSDDFSKGLKQNGYLSPGGSMMARDATLSAEKIAASNSIFSKMKFNITHPKEMLESLDVLGGKLANSSRERIAKAHYVAAKKAGMTDQQAYAEAVYAGNNVLPNYQRTAALMKQLNSAIPYSAASVAGTRSLTRALGSDPKAWARLAAVGVAPVVASTAYSLASPSGQEFYKDMHDSEKDYVLDNNIVVVLPGAHKDPKSGAWTGVWKIPVAPELRALNKSIWRGAATAIGKGGDYGATPEVFATTIFDTMTGGLRSQSSPVVDSALIALNIDPQNFKPVVKGNMANEEKKDQVYDSTSEAAAKIAGLTGNSISPIQVDKMLGQFSLTGELIQNRGGNPASTVGGNIARKFNGAYGKTDSGKYYDRVDEATKGLNSNELAAYNSLHPQKKNSRGDSMYDKTLFDTQDKAATYLRYPKVFEADKEANRLGGLAGELTHPLFDLSSDQQKVIFAMQANPSDEPMAKKLTKDNPWLTDYYKTTGEFYDKVKAKQQTDLGKLEADLKKDPSNKKIKEEMAAINDSIARAGIDPNGVRMVVADDNMQKKLDTLNTLTDKKMRAKYYEDNPDVLDFYKQKDEYDRYKRKSMGFPLYDKYPEPAPETKKIMDVYNKLPKGDGPAKRDGTASSPTRSAWIKSHPNEWAALTDYYNIKSQYDLAQAGSNAVYEGEGFNEDDYKDILSLAKSSGGGSGGGYGSGYGGGGSGGSPNVESAYKYAVSLKAGGSVAKNKPSVKVGNLKKSKVSAKGSNKPKVTMKKSLV